MTLSRAIAKGIFKKEEIHDEIMEQVKTWLDIFTEAHTRWNRKVSIKVQFGFL